MAKKNNNRTYLIILIVLLGVYLLLKFVVNTTPDSNFDMNALSIDTAKIKAITIKQPKWKSPVKLALSNGQWEVSQGEQKAAADRDAIKSLLRVMAEMDIQSIAATDAAKWKDFQLTDSLATEVQVYGDGGKLLKDFYLGKFSYKQNPSAGGMYGRRNGISGLTYVRLSEGDESFIVNGFLPMSFKRDFNAFRDQTLVRLGKDKIQSLTFDYPADSSFVLSKTDSAVWMINHKDTADIKKVNRYLSMLSRLKERKFAEHFTPAGKALYRFQFSGDGFTPVQVEVFPKDSVNYVLHSSQNPAAYFLSNEKGVLKRLKKGKNDFIK